MDDLLKIGAAYVRVSDERQDEFSPASQTKKIREYAKKEGYLIPDEYIYYDDGISGRSTKGRDEFKRMISDAVSKDHPFDKLYVWKLSRFSRSMEDSIIYKSMLEKKGVKVVSVSEPISNDIYGKLMERFLEWDAQFYSERLSEEVRRGFTEKISRGEPIVPPPFGYIMKDKKYYPDEESGAADVIREIFQRYANGDGMREIVTSFHDRGIKTKNGAIIDNRRIEYILHNPCYIGKIRWSPDGTKSVSRRKYDNENIVTVDGNHKPIISMELWDQVQRRIVQMKAAYPKYARKEQPVEYMLKSLVKCGSCGASLTACGYSGKAKVPFLQCCNYIRGSCRTSHSILVPKLEAAFIQGLENALSAKEFTLVPKTSKKSDITTIAYDKLIAVEERRLARAKEAFLAEIDSIEQYAENKKEITARIDELIAKRDKDTPVEVDIDTFANKVSDVIEFIKRKDVSPKAKNEELHTIIEKIVFEKAKGNLAIYFHDI